MHTLIRDLTDREREIFFLVRKNFTNLEIAEAISMSVQTVKKDLQNIYSKLNLEIEDLSENHTVRRRIMLLELDDTSSNFEDMFLEEGSVTHSLKISRGEIEKFIQRKNLNRPQIRVVYELLDFLQFDLTGVKHEVI